MIRLLAIGVVIVIAAAVAIFFFAQSVRRSSLFFPMRYPEGFWDTSALPIQPEERWVATPDGVRLNAWLFRAHEPDAPLLIYFHGNAGNIGERAPIASTLAARGISVLLFDWRGYGKSEGRPTETALYRDALAAYEAGKLISPNISLYGESLGGPYAAYVAKERGARRVVIENSFPSLSELGNALYAPIPVGWTAPFSLTTARWLNEAGAPVLVMHGKPDQVVPFKLGMSLYKQLRVPKELLVSETAGHCELSSVEREKYYDTVVRFVKSGL
ncbi:MAG TPA: alpha/beta hydrolase [Thermoanaerobaculia bacterium]|nr:alpha/beta hydrolase [Thermoanaerobaculia bacterium]